MKSLLIALVSFAFYGQVWAQVGVNDDTELSYDVNYACPYTMAASTPVANATYYDDGATDDYGPAVPANYPGFVFFYTWMCCISVFSFMYFAYNQRFAKIGEQKPFLPESKLTNV
jgi:hypothetical protein